MSVFTYRDGTLHAENIALTEIAEQFGTPLYVYSRQALEQHMRDYQRALGDWPGMICYAVKANSNLAVLNVLARLGAGFDIVSQGELERVLAPVASLAALFFRCRQTSQRNATSAGSGRTLL